MRQLQTPEITPAKAEPMPETEEAKKPEATDTAVAVAEVEPTAPFDTDSETETTVAAEPAKEPEEVEVSDPSIMDELTDQERQLLDAIYKQTVRVAMLNVEEKRLSSKLQELSEELNASKKIKQSLLDELPGALLKLRDGIEEESASESNTDAPSVSSVANNESAPEDDSDVLTKTITKDVPNLGPKKVDALIDAFPTLGELEQARAESVRQRVHFSKVLPRGIGKETADELEKRLCDALVGNNVPCSEQVEPRVEPEASEKPQASKEPAAEATDETDWVTSTADTMRSEITDGSFDSKSDGDAWRAGYDAFENNQPVTDCDQDKSKELSLDWIRGWLAAEHLELSEAESEAAEEAEAKSQDATDEIYDDVPDDEDVDSADEPATEIDNTDRQQFADHVKETGDTKSKHDQEIWQEGYQASLDEQPLEACPSSLTDDQESDWIRGWVEGSSLAFDL